MDPPHFLLDAYTIPLLLGPSPRSMYALETVVGVFCRQIASHTPLPRGQRSETRKCQNTVDETQSSLH